MAKLYTRKKRMNRHRPTVVFTYLSRAVDDEGEVLEVLVQSRRNKRAAVNLMRKLLRKRGNIPDQTITDKLGSYSAALRDLGCVPHPRHRWQAKQSSRSFTWLSQGSNNCVGAIPVRFTTYFKTVNVGLPMVCAKLQITDCVVDKRRFWSFESALGLQHPIRTL